MFEDLSLLHGTNITIVPTVILCGQLLENNYATIYNPQGCLVPNASRGYLLYMSLLQLLLFTLVTR